MAITAVIGLGQLGEAVATYLSERGMEVIAIDTDLDRVEAIKNRVVRALCLDATNERALRAAGVAEADTVVLALGEKQLEQAVLATMLLRELGVGKIISRAATEVQAKVLERLGVTQVVFPERQVGRQIARQILSPNVRDIIPLSDGTSVAEVTVAANLAGTTIGQANIRSRFGLNVVAVRRPAERTSDDGTIETAWTTDNTPGPSTELRAGDVLVVVGSDDRIRQWAKAE